MPFKPPRHRPVGQATGQEQRRAYDRRRDQQEWRRWYKTAAWQRKRAAQLAAEPLCANCRREGRITAASVADHVERHQGRYEAFWSGALQSLCASCHSSVKQRDEGRSSTAQF